MENSTLLEIKVGSLVGLKQTHENPDVLMRLRGWISAYGRGPFLVFAMCDGGHVSLKDPNGKEMHFGSTVDPSLNVGYIEPWCE